MATRYITTSIPYVNARPHLGFALELVQADALARYHTLRGDDVRFLTGTDENSLSNVLAAERADTPVRDFVDANAAIFFDLAARLDLAHHDFIRTASDRRHLLGAQAFWRACARRGDIYRRQYRGLYCVGCETFYAEDELADGRCPEHGTAPDLVEEENYFFRLSCYQGALERLLDAGELRVIPAHRHAEARAFVARGLEDFSVSRSRERAHGWGIPVPDDPSQVLYVWFDALTNYLTALGYGTDAALYRRYWLENPNRTHLIGKGILRFHAVYWPAMLLSAGEPLPSTLLVHGYLTRDGRKLSKSLGHTVDPFPLIERFGADAVRHWLLGQVPPFDDADYTDRRFEAIYNAALANDLGNLVQRTVSMLWRYRDGLVPPADGCPEPIGAILDALPERLHVALSVDHDPSAALRAIWRLVEAANQFVERQAPWALARRPEAAADLDGTLFALAEAVRLIGQALRPLLPGTADAIERQLGCPSPPEWAAALRWGGVAPGTRVATPTPLFPRADSASLGSA